MSEKRILFFISAFFLFLLLSLVLFTTDGYGGADSFQHYLISRYSWKHPHLFLDHWGKPFFTLLSSPFSQFGYKGLLLFNVLATLISSFFVYRISKKLNEENSILSALFFLAMPIVLLVSISSLTEPLFGLLLIISIWLFADKKYFYAIALLSFLPLVRTEGFVVFPVFIIALLLNRKWKYLPLFILGGLIYSLAGYFVLDDFFWLINSSPYKLESGIYGSGTWYHFIKNSWFIFGLPLSALIIIGSWFYLPKNIKWLQDENNILRILIAGSFAVYFVSHSYVWWKGTGGSLGLERVIAGVCPLAALIALSGYNYIKRFIKNVYVSPLWILIPFLTLVARVSFIVYNEKSTQLVEQRSMALVAEWIKSNPSIADQKIYYYNPHIAFLLDKDIFDREEAEQLWSLINEDDPLLWLKDGQYLVWDSQFGVNEGRTPLEKLIHKQNVKILKHFMPDEQHYTLGGSVNEIFVFGKQSGWKDTIVEFVSDTNSMPSLFKNKDFSILKDNDYVNVFEENFAALSTSEIAYLEVVITYPIEKKLAKDDLFFVFDMRCNQHTLKYDASDVSVAQHENYRAILTKHFMLPPLTKECNTVKAYFWNRGKIDLQEIRVEMKLSHVPQYPY